MKTIVDVFLSPGAAMDSLAERPRFLAALLLLVAAVVAMTAVANQRGVVEHFIRAEFENNPRMEQIPAEQREQITEQAVRWGVKFSWVGGLTSIVALLAASGLFLLLAHGLAGAGVRFSQMFAVVTHAWLPAALQHLISVPILLAKDPEMVDMRNVVSMANLSPLFSPTEQKKLYAVASSLDLFTFWVIALLAVGIARLTGKGKGLALAIVLPPWLLYVLIFKVLLG